MTTCDGHTHHIDKWDLLIAHPPCTYLTVAGNRWFNVEKYGEKAIRRIHDREEGIKFFMAFINADCDHIAVENPIGIMSNRYRKPDQIIQPYEYGHRTRKATCLWLKNLPKLIPTDIVDPEIHKHGFGAGMDMARDENEKVILWNDPRTAKARSKTFQGIATAIARQWSEYLEGLQCTEKEKMQMTENIDLNHSQGYYDTLQEMRETFDRKNADYGNSFAESCYEFGLGAGVVRISDKFNRLKTLWKNPEQAQVQESIEDTLLDLANYSAMLRAEFLARK